MIELDDDLRELACPRCACELRKHEVDATATLDVCPTCAGLFIEGSELLSVCVTLSHLPDRREEAQLSGRRGAGIARCPRCLVPPYELVIVGQAIDFCVQCAGVWLDGPEREPLGVRMTPLARPDAGPGGAYRRAVDQTRATDSIKCAHCREQVRVKDAFVRPVGYVCRGCEVHFSWVEATLRQRGRPPEEDTPPESAAGSALSQRAPEGAALADVVAWILAMIARIFERGPGPKP